MPKAQKTTAKKATAKTDISNNTIKTNEQALQEITSNQSWPLYELPQTYVCGFTVLTLLLHSVNTAFF